MEFPERVTRPFRRGALVALVAGAGAASAGLALLAIASYHVGGIFREASAGAVVTGGGEAIGALLDASRTLVLVGGGLAVVGLIALSVAGAAAWPARDAKRSILALGAGVAVAFVVTMLDQLGGRPEGPSKPMLLGLAATGAVLCAHHRAALVVALVGAAAFVGRVWQGAQYPPWFEPRDMLLPREGAEAIWGAAGFALLAAALALVVWSERREKADAQAAETQAASGVL